MPTQFGVATQSQYPENMRQTPLVTVRRVTTTAGNAGGTTLVDSYLANLTDNPTGLSIVRRPDDSLRFEVRQISSFNAVTGEVTVGTAFSSQIVQGEAYGVVTLVSGGSGGGAIGTAADAAVYVSSAVATGIAYLKGLINQFGDISGHALNTVALKFGNMTESLLTVLGARADAAVQTTADASMHARLKGLLTSIGNPSADTLVSITAKMGNLPATLTAILGNPTGGILTSFTALFGNMAVSLATKTEPFETALPPFNFVNPTTNEQVIFTVNPALGQVWELDDFDLDLSTLTQNATIKIQRRIDGVNWRTVTNVLYVSGGTDAGAVPGKKYIVTSSDLLRVSIVSSIAEGANRNVPGKWWYRRVT